MVKRIFSRVLGIAEARAFAIVGFAVLLAVMLWVAATAPPTTMPSNNAAFAQYDKKHIHYFALGDSVASGHGLPGEDQKDPCRRSPNAYPSKVHSLLEERYQVNFPTKHHLACSGATTVELKNQVDTMIARSEHITDEPILVSITIGMNDFGFPIDANKEICQEENPQNFNKFVDETIMNVRDQVTNDVKRLLAKPNVVVVVTEYYNPLNKVPTILKRLPQGRKCDLARARERTEDIITRINSEYAAAVAELEKLNPSRVHIAPIKKAFEGNEAPKGVCGEVDPPDETWIQEWGDPGLARPDCFHPNGKGAEAIAKAVDAAAIKAGLKRNGFILLLA